MLITVDAMGGDSFPSVPIEGALLALKELQPHDFSIELIGDQGVIKQYLQRKNYPTHRLHIVDAQEVVAMDEKVETAMRKKQSSIVIGLEHHAKGISQGFISAGNTAAVMALAVLKLRPIPGINRPAIAATFPTISGPCVVLDVGATVDCKPNQLRDFGVMGAIYAHDVIGIETPKVALISVGEEPSKGNEATKKAHELLLAMHENGTMHFIGNVEGRDVLSGKADVIVTDGFTGNIILKLSESLIPSLNAIIKKIIRGGRWDQKVFATLAKGIFLGPTIGALKRTFDVEKYGGAPLLGIDGTVIIAHGKSTPRAIMNGIDAVRKAVQSNVTGLIREKIHNNAPHGAS